MKDTLTQIDLKEDFKNLVHAKELIRAVNHTLRRKILRYIHENPNCCVKDIYKSLEIEQSVVSQHLRILRTSNIVINTRKGKNIFYRLDYDYIQHLTDCINDFIDE